MTSLGLTVSQSTDAKTLTLTDTSIGNKTGFTRSVEIYTAKDGTGTKTATIPFVGTGLTATYAITADAYRSYRLVYVGSPTIAPIFVNQTSIGFSQNLLFSKLNKNCGCQKKPCSSTMLGFIYQHSSQIATASGNSGLANSFITASNKWLKS